jgi:hypothetical protein
MDGSRLEPLCVLLAAFLAIVQASPAPNTSYLVRVQVRNETQCTWQATAPTAKERMDHLQQQRMLALAPWSVRAKTALFYLQRESSSQATTVSFSDQPSYWQQVYAEAQLQIDRINARPLRDADAPSLVAVRIEPPSANVLLVGLVVGLSITFPWWGPARSGHASTATDRIAHRAITAISPTDFSIIVPPSWLGIGRWRRLQRIVYGSSNALLVATCVAVVWHCGVQPDQWSRFGTAPLSVLASLWN